MQLIASAIIAPVLFGCTPSPSGGASEETEEIFTFGESTPAGRMELSAPDAEVFLLHGTMPVPPGTWPSPTGKAPFVVVDVGGEFIPAQIETVSRYANPADGADVVELIARVHRPPGVQPGDRLQYEVRNAPHTQPSSMVPPDDAMGIAPSAVAANSPTNLRTLIENPDSIRITTRDVFGHTYEASPLADWPNSNPRILRWGHYQLQLGTYDTMMPKQLNDGSTGTLPHGLGVHSYMSVSAGSPVLQFDIRFNNAADGNNKGTDKDNPLGKMYFDSIDIEVPMGWVVMQDVEDPSFGPSFERAGSMVYPIVASNADGTMHSMPSQAQFHRRLVLVQAGEEVEGRRVLDQQGLAFAVPEAPGDNQRNSWQNTNLPRFLTQAHAIPSLDYMGLDNVRAELAAEQSEVRGHLAAGTSMGKVPITTARLGWAHPSGIPYKGMTGGWKIHLFDGVRTASSASTEGYLGLSDQFRMTNDRMPNALYSITGQPSRVADWLEGSGANAYVPFTQYNGKLNGNADPFGYDLAPTFQRDFVAENGKAPAYEAELDGFQAHDRQHLVRYAGAVKALAWLGNDWLAKDALLMMAESFHMEYHGHYNSSVFSIQGTGLLSQINYVQEHPGEGFDIGRGEGWGIDVVVASYALTTNETWRAETRDWLGPVVDMLFDGQADCSGIIGSKINKWLGGNYRVRSSIEMSILESALRAARERVFDQVDSARYAMLGDVLHDSYYGLIGNLSWAPGNAGPWSHLAVGPLDTANMAPYCLQDDLPADGQDGYLEDYQCWSSLAFGFEMTGNTEFLERARLMTGGGSLTASLQADGTKNLGNRSALLALVQEIGD
ncbi:MAG: hypothetical protein ACJAZ8_001337 [Planctomycetota bacterium]|jgi:hypothetical protein